MPHEVQEELSLAGFTTLGIGGPARYFLEASTEDEVLEGIEFARARDLPLLVLGGGSNILVSDAGFPGLALQMRIGGVRIVEDDEHVSIVAGAGVSWDALVAECVAEGLYGVECLSGIPGWVGATPIQNVGAYGQEVSSVISSVRTYDSVEDRVVELSSDDCAFGYRESLFNTTARGRYLVLGVKYRLKREGGPAIEYPDLQRYFEGRTPRPALSEVRGAVLEVRRSKAMLLEAGDPDCRSAGSFFKNPVVSAAEFDRIAARAVAARSAATREEVPCFPVGSGRMKVPAGWLIERSGFSKGTPEGPVGLSKKHALALVNRGGGTARDVLRVAGEVRERVEAVFGVRLVTEPVFVGFPDAVIERFGAVSA